ncbi:MBL fold metallo-hydrolase [Peribacillus muralis]|uniref:MBL fold metallo-hydrolase n=1 Tax=Peribacillus muralis TaxID=264697 RepID=UPI003CFD3D91
MKNIVDPWFTVQELDDMTYAISEYGHWEKVHSFLLIGKIKAALIDTGLDIDSIKRITNQLTDLPIIVLTTHVHADHIGGHGEFDKIYVHADDADWLINGIKGLSLNRIRKDMARDITKALPESFDPSTYIPYLGTPDGILADGDSIDLGNRSLSIYHTPGHSPGHISILDCERGYLFTGDLLYSDTPIYEFYPSTNPVDLVNSLERIAKIKKVSKIFGSHNQLGLVSNIQEEVLKGTQYLKDNDLIRHGTGIHTFKGFSVHF